MRYPFMAAVNRFMESYFGVYAPGMYSELQRRYPKISKQLIELEIEGKISTTDPSKLTPEDIKAYVTYLKSKKLKEASVSHDLSAIRNLCMFISGNNCVEVAKIQYPILFQRQRHVRLPVTERPEFERICEYANSFSPAGNYRLIRGAAEVMLTYGAGLRTQETQHTKIRHLDPQLRYIYLDHVKGMNSYGSCRTVPIRPEAAHILSVWLKVRKSDSEYLFPNQQGQFLSTNSFEVDRRFFVANSGIEFDYRKCRRTYAQYLIDEGIPIEEVAVILGHASSRTTERAYARPRDDRVVRKIIEKWKIKEIEV